MSSSYVALLRNILVLTKLLNEVIGIYLYWFIRCARSTINSHPPNIFEARLKLVISNFLQLPLGKPAGSIPIHVMGIGFDLISNIQNHCKKGHPDHDPVVGLTKNREIRVFV